MPDPIRQEITTSFDATGIDQAVASNQDLAEEVQLASERAKLATNVSRQQEAALAQLVQEQQAYQARLAAGDQVDQDAEARAKDRASAISTLSARIRERRAAEDRAAATVRELTRGEQQAAGAEKSRAQVLGEQRARLEELVRVQHRYERETDQGKTATEEASQAERERQAEIDRLGRELAEEQRIQDRTTDAVRRHSTAQDDGTAKTSRFDAAIDGLSGRMAGLVASIVGAGGLIRALQIMGEEMDRRIEQTREFAEAQLNLQFLNESFDEQEREFIGKAAVLAGRSLPETARAFTDVRSFFPNLSKSEVQEFFLQVAESGATTDAPLSSVAKLQQSIFAINRDADAAQNIAREATIQAGVGNPDVLANVFGKLLSVLVEVGNVDVGQAAGAASAVTGLDTREPSEQATGLRSVILSLLGDLSDEQTAIVNSAGIDRSNALTALGTLGVAIQSGKLDNASLEKIVGAEGIATAAAFADPVRRGEFFSKVQTVDAAEKAEEDRTTAAINRQFAEDPVQGNAYAIKQVEALQTVAESSDAESLRSDLARKLLSVEQTKAGVGPVGRFLSRESVRLAQLLGVSDDTAVAVGAGALDLRDILTLQLLSPGDDKTYEASQRAREQLRNVDETGRIQVPGSTEPGDSAEPSSHSDERQSSLSGGDTATHALLRELIDRLSTPARGTSGAGTDDAMAQLSGSGPRVHIHGPINNYARDPINDFEDHLSGYSSTLGGA